MREIVSGTIYSNRQFFDGYVELENGIIRGVYEEEGTVGESHRLILPLIPNCHTHIGDYCLRGKVDPSQGLDKLVRPPNGVKHRLLATLDKEEVLDGIRCALREMSANGTSVFVDFREGGMMGLDLMGRALRDVGGPRAVILSRPENLKYDEKEVDLLLDHSQGIGLSALSDWNYDDMMRISQHVKSRGKIFAFHASEARRENIDKILDLEPDFLVHMASATDDDLLQCKEEGIPIVICPRSNSIFNIPLDISRMIDIGVTICLGTDNAMLNTLSMIEEMRAAYSLRSNSRKLQVEEIFQLALENPRKIINGKSRINILPGEPVNFIVIESEDRLTPETLIGSDISYSIRMISA